jgi:hypothetical protein
MLDPAAKAEFERQYRLVLVIYAAMLASILIYLGIGFLLVRTLPAHAANESARSFVVVFYCLAAVFTGVILWQRKSWTSPPASSASAPPDMLESISRYRTGHIVAFVLCEVIALFGVLVLLLVGSFSHLVYFASLSLTMMIVCYPKRME